VNEPIHLISLGAGVQSSTMALMAAVGEITPMPTAAIFADTQAEPASVYKWLDWLETQLPFPVYRVTKGSLSVDALKTRVSAKGITYGVIQIPFFTLNDLGETGKIGGRKCTSAYKIIPIVAQARQIVGRKAMSEWRRKHKSSLSQLRDYKQALAGYKRAIKQKMKWPRPIFPMSAWRECQADPLVVQWIGISTDEFGRAKESRDPWIMNRWPLLEQRVNRRECRLWLSVHDCPEPTKSACRFCPFRDNAGWQNMKLNEPQDFALAVQFERDIQAARKGASPDASSQLFLHQSCKPLDTIDFRSDVERGQGLLNWNDECEGMCGV
jgi:hypothetical protein